MASRISGLSEYSLEDYKERKRIVDGTQEIAYSDLKFETDSGKIELYSANARSLWNCNELPSYSKAFEDEKKSEGSLIFLSPNTKNRIQQ